jgi:C-5 cytosine-specific DNA methylase
VNRPLLLDAFCGAGGAAMGYHQAGFEVIGVDIVAQPRYPFEFYQGDALDFIRQYGKAFDAIHASPPCQTFTKEAGQHDTRELHKNLIPPTRATLVGTEKPYIIENVLEARSWLISPIMLCGTMFNLGVFRHRLFEMPWWAHHHPEHHEHTGRIGDGRYVTVTGHSGGSSLRDNIIHGDKQHWQQAMGIDWMVNTELAQAIPPAYTEYIGRFLMKSISRQPADSAVVTAPPGSMW